MSARNIVLVGFVALFVLFVVGMCLVGGRTEDAATGNSIVGAAAESVSDAVDSVNEAIENSPVGEAIEKMDNARSQ